MDFQTAILNVIKYFFKRALFKTFNICGTRNLQNENNNF